MNCLFVMKGVPERYKTFLETFKDIFHCPKHDPSGENIKTGTRCGIYSPVCIPELYQIFMTNVSEGKEATIDLYSNGESHTCEKDHPCNRETCGEELMGVLSAVNIGKYYCLKCEFMEGPMNEVIYLLDDGLKIRMKNLYYLMSGDYDEINNVDYNRIVEFRPIIED